MSLTASLRKELLLKNRSKANFFATWAFGLVVLLLFSFGTGPNASLLRPLASAFLWLALLLASTISLMDSFLEETREGALEGLVILPASLLSVYYGKAVANWMHLSLLGIGLLPPLIVLFDVDPARALQLIPLVFLGAAGIAAPGTLYAAMAIGTRARGLVLPLLLFPLVVPALLAAVNAGTFVLDGDPMDQARSWMTLLVLFDAIYWALCGLMFSKVVDLAGAGPSATHFLD